LLQQRFKVEHKRRQTTQWYEWWPATRLKKEKIVDFNTGRLAQASDDGKVDVATVELMLKDHGINSSKFGVGSAKTMREFCEEVSVGAAVLMLDAAQHKTLVRVVDVVLLRVGCGEDPKSRRYLTEIGETYADGRSQKGLKRLVGAKKEPHENTKQTAERILVDVLDMRKNDFELTFDEHLEEVFEEQEESPSYPGVRTVYRKHVVACEVKAKTTSASQRVGLKGSGQYSHKNHNNITQTFEWLSEQACMDRGVKLRAPAHSQEVSSLILPPVGLHEDAPFESLTTTLEKARIDPEKFGKQNTKTLKEFSDELITGEALLEKQPNGSVLRIVDIVLLKIVKAGGNGRDVVVQLADGGGARLPGAKRRPDENQFVTAQRILKQHLKVCENTVTMDRRSVLIMEEEKDSPSYPGMRTLYRKRIITAEVGA
jgi:hypothetical protein